MARPHDAVQSRLLRSGDDPGTDRRRRHRRAVRAQVARLLVAPFLQRRSAGLRRPAAAGDRRRADRCRVADRGDRLRRRAPACGTAGADRLRPARVRRAGGRRPRSRRRLRRAARALALSPAGRDARSHRHPGPGGLRRRRASRGAAFSDRRPPRFCRPGAVSGGARRRVAHGEGAHMDRRAGPDAHR